MSGKLQPTEESLRKKGESVSDLLLRNMSFYHLSQQTLQPPLQSSTNSVFSLRSEDRSSHKK